MKLLEGVKHDRIMATGYGRHLLEVALDAPTVTEIKAYAGGVARNACMVTLLKEALQTMILVPENPQMVGALGAALIVSSG